MLNVIATIQAKPGKESALETLLKGLLTPTHAEKGCLLYSLHRHTEKPGTFFMVERWASPEALKEHLASAHIQAAFAQSADLLESIDIASLTTVSGGILEKSTF